MLIGLLLYHTLEFFAVSYIKGGIPKNFHDIFDRLLISADYLAAISIGILEYVLEWFFVRSLKESTVSHICYYIGIVMVVLGDGLRKWAILYNNKGFDHYIQYQKIEGQQLVTTGPYAISRHPAYCGWFYMTLGFMVMLANPISFVIYWVWSYYFFKSRIEEEERTLCVMFKDYPEYKKKVPVRIPGIK